MHHLRLYRTEAVVLKRTDFGEADRMLTIYTPGLGKLRVLAKGIRRPLSKMAGHLELFAHSQILLAKGRNIDIVTQCETITSFPALREDLLRTTYAHYVAELLEKLTPEHVEDYPLFALLVNTLRRLDADHQPEMAVRLFEMEALQNLGYRPQLQRCAHCDRPLEPVPNFFAAHAGGVLCPRCGSADATARALSVNALKVLRLLQSGNYAVASQLRLEEPLRHEIEAHLRSLLLSVLERDIKSASFISRLRAEIQGPRGQK